MSLAPPAPNAPLPYGAPVTLTGDVRGVTGARSSSGRPAARGSGRPGRPRRGEASRSSRRSRPTTGSRQHGAAARPCAIRVAPLVQVDARSRRRRSQRHGAAGASRSHPCRFSSRTPTATWTTVATGAVDADGSFSVPVRLTAGGTYRVSVAPGAGYRRRRGAAASRGALSRLALLVARASPRSRAAAPRCRVRPDRPARREAVVPRRTTTPSTRGRSRRRRSHR